jgi:hypothetical protein
MGSWQELEAPVRLPPPSRGFAVYRLTIQRNTTLASVASKRLHVWVLGGYRIPERYSEYRFRWGSYSFRLKRRHIKYPQ